MKNTELDLFNAITEALMGERIPSTVLSVTGTYARGDRRLQIDFGDLDIGPIIGAAGATKLAIQTLLACPFGGDNCHLVLHSTRQRRTSIQGQGPLLQHRLERIMKALREHLDGSGSFTHRIEASPSATVVLVETSPIMVEALRGALSKLIRAIGRKHGTVAVLSIETPAFSNV